MPFLLRQSDYPTLATIQQIPQIVIIDKSGPQISLGVANKAVCLVGEFLKGPFIPTEVTSSGDLQSFFGGLVAPANNLAIISQSALGPTTTQDGGGVGFNGNGIAQLKGKQFRRLIIQRVDCDAVTTDGGTTKAVLTVTVGGTPSPTTQDIVIPAGTRFADNVTPTVIVATSQDYTIPKGATLPATVSPNVFFVKGTTAGIAGITVVLDSAIPSAPTTTTITTVTNATTIFPPNTGASLQARIAAGYSTAIDKTLPNDSPMNDINVIWSARNDVVVRPYLVTHAITASSSGPGRMAIVAADPALANTVAAASTAKSAAISLASTESYAQPADRAIISFPHVQIFAAELNANITVNSGGYMASLLSNLAEEVNPGVAASQYTSTIQGLEPAFQTSGLTKQDYINLLAGGVAPLQKDRQVGWWYVNGVTAANPALYQTRVPIKRRRMADFIQDSIFQIAATYNKQPATIDRVDSFVAAMEAFLAILKSPQNPSLQRIVDYRVDGKSRNQATLNKLGIYTFLIAVQLLASMDDIILETVIGETVSVTEAA